MTALHTEKVRAIFETITERYDFLNHFLSGGLDRRWREAMTASFRFQETYRYLDLATGTGDVALSCANRYPQVTVEGLDFAQAMLEKAHKKITARGYAGRIALKQADATRLPFSDQSFDTVGMAFGIRNIPRKEEALREMVRVLVPGGRVVILELTTPENSLIRKLYSLHLTRIMPWMAGTLTKKKEAYRYLASSILDFPTRPAFLKLLEEAQLKNIKARPLACGICHLYIGER